MALVGPPTRALSPVIPNNACLSRITAAAGTELAEAFSGLDQRRMVLPPLVFLALKEVYIPKEFVLHAALLRQAFAHCGRFVTAATRRCPGSVSVPMWPVNLSVRLPVVALVGRYLTNKLIGNRPFPGRQARRSPPLVPRRCRQGMSSGITVTFAKEPKPRRYS